MFYKSYEQQFDSSIAHDPVMRSVFNDMCALADQRGIVDMTYQAIAARTRWPIETVVSKIGDLMKPDPESRSKKCEGARLVLLDGTRSWGWRVVNYTEYRKRRDSESRQTQNRDAQRRWRERQKEKKEHKPEGLRKPNDYGAYESADVSGHKQTSAMPSPDARETVSHSNPESAQCRGIVRTPLSPLSQGGNGGRDSRIPIPQDPDPLSSFRLAKEKNRRRRDYIEEEPEPEPESNGWTDELVAAARLQFPDAKLPEKFNALPVDIRAVIQERLKKMAS